MVDAILASAAAYGARAEPERARAPLCAGGSLGGAMGTWLAHAPQRVVCANERDVADALAQIERAGARCVVVGACHSWAPPHAGARCAWLHVHGLRWAHVLPFSPSSPSSHGALVRAGAGMRLSELGAVLRAHGLCLPSVPMHLDATLGGALCCGSHGSSLVHGSLADLVTDVRIVTADGRAAWLHDGGAACAHGEVLAAARVSCGVLGVLVAAELSVCPIYAVRRGAQRVPLRTAQDVAALLALAASHEHAWVHWRLGEDDAILSTLSRQPEQQASSVADPTAADERGVKPYDGLNWFGHGTADAQLPPDGTGADEAADDKDEEACTRAHGPPARSTAAARTAWVSSEYALPLARAPDGVAALRAALGESHRGRLVELKFVGPPQRDTLLACNSGAPQGACCFNVWWRTRAEHAADVVRPFEVAMQRLCATPHWGKARALPPGYVGRVFGARAERFCKVSRALDPGGVFAQPWLTDAQAEASVANVAGIVRTEC